jgi:tRNA modification GTPase
LSYTTQDTIIALATPAGSGAIAVIRLSGPQAITLTNSFFKGKNLTDQATHTIHFGTLVNEEGQLIDEVLVSLFIAPRSFTKENVVEISCHGSQFIVQQILNLFIRNGVRHATAGEFTKRAFLNGQFDLVQAEAIADLIAADSAAAHSSALSQLKGGFSNELKELREKLIHFASLIELELDFGEEDVEFADRDQVERLINQLLSVLNGLLASFVTGRAIKNGVPTVIAGKPNVGKSTLLNALLNEEKAIVSDIAGTTRDFIEDELIINGIHFRFIDTAGLRESSDEIEKLGIARTREKMSQASLILYLVDLKNEQPENARREYYATTEGLGKPVVLIGNKADTKSADELGEWKKVLPEVQFISAAQKLGLDELQNSILEAVDLQKVASDQTIITTARHYQSLLKTKESLAAVLDGLQNGVSGDFLAMDIRHSLHHLGEITGEITTDNLLANIFSKFCIGK